MKYIIGFFMTWGNFCALPCPYKRWEGKYKSIMLGFLPTIGLIIGILWAAIYFGLVYLSFPYLVVAFIVTFIPFALCGFLHLDGFMDCSDAIMSRRPLEDRQRILKDSHTGAFAVVSVVFLLLGFYSCISMAISAGIDFVNMILIVVLSRCVSGLEVLISKPMSTSQYVEMTQGDSLDTACEESEEPKEFKESEQSKKSKKTAQIKKDDKAAKPTTKEGVALLLVQLLIITFAALWCSSSYISTGIVCAATFLGTFIAVTYAKKQLGGMNGDIAGYGIVWGELIGVFSLIFC